MTVSNICGTITVGQVVVSIPPICCFAETLTLFPNPSNGIFNLSGEILNGKWDVYLLGGDGRRRYLKTYNVFDNYLDASFNLQRKLAGGIHYLVLVSEKGRIVKPFVVSK